MIDQKNVTEVIGNHNLTKLFSQAPAPIAIYKGRELRYAFVNDAYSRIFNYREIVGKTVREAFPELEGQSYFEILENVFDTGTPYFGNETPALIDLNGDGNLVTRYYNLVYTPYKNDNDQIEGVMAFGHDVTDQVEVRNKERESDLRFKNIVQQSTDPILILKGEELVLEVANQALFRLWNVDESALGKPFLDILPEMKHQVFYELLLDVYHNGKTHYGYETIGYFERENKQKETHYFNFIYQPYYEADNKITGVLVLATDVTEQVLAKQKLDQSEINFRNMILQAPVAMAVLKGKDFVVEIANQFMFELWGKQSEVIINKPIFEGLPEAKGQGLEVLLEGVYNTGNRFSASERPVQLPRNGGLETVYLNFVYEAFRAGDGSISGIIVIGTEVTEQVSSRRKVEYAEENSRLAIESASLGTYDLNMITNEVKYSERFRQIWGVDGQDRDAFAAAILPEDLATRNNAHQLSLQTGTLHYEARIKHKDGKMKWVKVDGKVMFDDEKKPVRLLGVIQDVTDEKEFAEALSLKVEERTSALRVANERLEKSNEELEQFAFVTSHDLQEPLRKIQLFSNMAMEQDDREKVKGYLTKVHNSANRMAGLIKDLLDYSRLSQEGLQFQKVDLNVILKNILTDFEVAISQKNAMINAAPLPSISAIPLQMNQLLFNLVGNALKFSKPDTPPVITITSKKLSEEEVLQLRMLNARQEYFEIKLSDNGIGFEQDYAEKIFTIFQTLNQKSAYGGYGIGLALCRKIVRNHSGLIFASSHNNEGATFSIILPSQQIN